MAKGSQKVTTNRIPSKSRALKKPEADKVNIDYVCELILEGKTYREISDILTVTLTTLHRVCNSVEHSARIRESLSRSADEWEEKAEKVLKELSKSAKAGEIVRARELAHHYRWKASKRDPKRFGDKLDVTSDNKALNTVLYLPQKNT